MDTPSWRVCCALASGDRTLDWTNVETARFLGGSESSDIVYSNIEIRKKGISLHFRFKNEEYLDCCHFNKLKIMSNDNVLTLQIENSIYKLQYKNPKQNNLLIKKIYNEKIYFNKEI